MSTTEPHLVAVLDVGKTNVKTVLFDPAAGREVWARSMPNLVRTDGPYPHFDTDRIADFFLDSLADIVRTAGRDLAALSVTTHGASGALIGPDGLALPVLDYEHDGPDSVADAYDSIRPAFAETLSPRLPGGLNLGAQLFWQMRCFPDALRRASAFVTYPQYWAWWMTGVAATEATSLGAHTDLWAPAAGQWSGLVARAGWDGLMAPLRSAFDALGHLRPDLAAKVGLDRPIPVCCGIHDSNASLLPHLQQGGAPLTIVSTGTWVIAFAVGGRLDRLDPRRDTLANVDAYRRPVPSARFMGGREFDILTNHAPVPEIDPAVVQSAIERNMMAWPAFVPGSGPFPGQPGRWSHDPGGLSAAERTTVASLYAALMTMTCLELLGAGGDTVVEGPFGRNALFCDALAVLTRRPVRVSSGGTGTSAGAARLAQGPEARPDDPFAAVASPPSYRFDDALARYAMRWREEAGMISGLTA